MKRAILILTAFLMMGATCSEATNDIYEEHNYCACEYLEQEIDEMAIKLSTDATLTGRIITDDAEYPNGKYKPADTSGGVPVPDTGTPIRASERADIAGFLEALLALGGLDASGLPDAPNPDDPATQGQYIEALTNWQSTDGLRIDEDTPGPTTDISLIQAGSINTVHYPAGAISNIISGFTIGGLFFSNWVGNPGAVYSAEAEFDIDIADLFVGTNVITYNPSPVLELSGILPTGMAIISCDLMMRENGVSQTTVSLNPAVLETGTYLEISGAQGFYASSTLQSFDTVKLRIKFDPRYIEQP